ncbi:MAG TPA: hypothetical protein PKY82_32395, partial [Pyrinomonadaceae bacterium]|nr:hypothetical protein [Pyrinomonadaceae bacterium]
VDTTSFPVGAGQLELRQFGGDSTVLNLNVYPTLPAISNVKVAKGDTQATIIGERLEQVQAIRINGRRAVIKGMTGLDYMNSTNINIQPPTDNQIGMNNIPTALSEKTFVFEDSNQWQDSNSVSLEIELNDQRVFQIPNVFAVSSARPTISANNAKEVEAFVVNRQINSVKAVNTFTDLPILPIETSEIGINIQNALTDFDFKIENLRIETRIENTQTNPFTIGDVDFEVLDWRSIKLNIRLNDQAKKMLGGRRIQFRICDKQRGNSDWYSIKQTFVRLPQGLSVKCLNKQCELTGKGINYIQQVSLDEGKTWFPQEPTGLVAKSDGNGLETATIPNLTAAKKSIKIKLRDFPISDGFMITTSTTTNR